MKLVVIGGGSSYTPELIEGVIKHHETLPITEVVLVDIEAGSLTGGKLLPVRILLLRRLGWEDWMPAHGMRGFL